MAFVDFAVWKNYQVQKDTGAIMSVMKQTGSAAVMWGRNGQRERLMGKRSAENDFKEFVSDYI